MKRLLLSVMLILGLVGTPLGALAAQPAAADTSFQSALSGDVIDLGGSGEIAFMADDYTLSEGRSVSEEYIWFTYNWSNFQVGIVQGDVDVASYYDATMSNMTEFYDTFEVIDESIGSVDAWFLAHANYQGTEMVVLYDYQLDAPGDLDLLVMQFAPAEYLVADMEFAQQEVTIGNQPLLSTTSPQDVEAILSGGQTGTREGDTVPVTGNGVKERMGRLGGPATGDTTTPEATEAAGTTRVTRTTRSTRATGTEEATTTATSSTTTRTTRTTRSTGSTQTTATAGGEWESMGLVSDTEWISPHFQTNVVWDGAMWAFPADNENAIYLDNDGDADRIVLDSVEGLGMGTVRISDAGTLIPADLVDFWSAPNLMKGPNNEDVVIIDIQETGDATAVIYQYVDENGETVNIILTSWFPGDGTMITTSIVSAPENAPTLYGQLIDGVQVNGESVGGLLLFTPEDVAGLVGND